MKGNAYILAYAMAISAASALLLTGAGRFAAPYRLANAKADEVRNILAVLEIPFAPSDPAGRLLEIHEATVRARQRGNITVYEYFPEGQIEPRSVAVRLAGAGVWGPIEGFMALEPDMRTIRGITFHKQEETPGLGGEIASESFRARFRGKTITGASGEAGIRIRRGTGEMGVNEVDAITGATMTSAKVEALINAAIGQIIQEDGDVE